MLYCIRCTGSVAMGGRGEDLFVMEKGVAYSCTITKRKEGRIQVHYAGYSGRHDEWLDETSDRIVPAKPVRPKRSAGGKSGEVTLSASIASGLADLRQRDDVNRSRRSSIALDPEVVAAENFIDTKIDEMDRYVDAEEDLQFSSKASDKSAEPVIAKMSKSGTQLSLSSPVVNESAVASLGYCSFCRFLLESAFVTCDGCKRPFHPEVVCLGVEQNAISVLLDCVNGSITYKCCVCRCSGPAEAGGSASEVRECMKQLISIVGGLAGQVRGVLSSTGSVVNARKTSDTVDRRSEPLVARREVMEEVREVYEREKRASSIILRGVGDINPQELISLFEESCSYLGVGVVALGEVRKVNNNIFRAKIIDREARLRLLNSAPKLKSSPEFRHIYIQRDLTFLQRQELFKRRFPGSAPESSVLRVVAAEVVRGASQPSEIPLVNSGLTEVRRTDGVSSPGAGGVRGGGGRGVGRGRGGGRGRGRGRSGGVEPSRSGLPRMAAAAASSRVQRENPLG